MDVLNILEPKYPSNLPNKPHAIELSKGNSIILLSIVKKVKFFGSSQIRTGPLSLQS